MAAPITDGVVRAAQDGEAAAFRVIYEELAPVVLGYLTAKGVADPEAVTADVFLAALPRLRELSGGAAGLRTFVMSVAHARMVDDARRRRRQPVWCQYDVGSDLRSAARRSTRQWSCSARGVSSSCCVISRRTSARSSSCG